MAKRDLTHIHGAEFSQPLNRPTGNLLRKAADFLDKKEAVPVTMHYSGDQDCEYLVVIYEA